MLSKRQKLKTNSRTRKRGLKNKKTSKNKFIKSKKNNNKLNIKIGGKNPNSLEYRPPPLFNNGNNNNDEVVYGFPNIANTVQGSPGNGQGVYGFPGNATGNPNGKNVAEQPPLIKPEPLLIKPEPPLYYKGINIFDNTKTLSIFNQYNSFTTKTNNIAIHKLFTSIFNNENIKKKNNDTKESGEIIFSFFAELLVYLENKNKLTKSDINVILKNYRIPFIKEVIPTYKVKLL